MARFSVEVRRSIVTTVDVEADTPEAAIDKVDRHDFELPPRDEWSGVKDWSYLVMDEDGNEVLERS
jgi:hypothetical protein